MGSITGEKLAQANDIVAASGADAWLTFVRETAEGGDLVLPFLIEGGLTWQSALLVTRTGQRIAIVGNYDADPLRASGDWHEVVPYVQSAREPLRDVLERALPEMSRPPRLAVNYSPNDVKADGLTHGMYLLLCEYLRGTRFENSLESAEAIVMALRGRKTPGELAHIRAAIVETERLFAEIETYTADFSQGITERDVYAFVQTQIDARRLGYAWDRTGDPIVNSGPDSMIGHGLPSRTIRLTPGHIFHIDLGVVVEGYSSDIQRCWYVPAPNEKNEKGIPADVQRALEAVTGAIQAGAGALRPGAQGWQVDKAARDFLIAAGYPEYLHALGHQVGRVAHDGGGLLGPRWERYGTTPFLPVEKDQVYTIELGVLVEGRGYLGLEEMVVVTETGCQWLTRPQTDMPLLGVV
jgi:Xaa-Pro dipeptidase